MGRNTLTKLQRKELQEKSLQMFRENPMATLQSVSLALGLSHSCVFMWIKDDIDGYKARYQQALKDAFESLESNAIASLSSLIEDKNFQAVKYVLDNRGYSAPKEIKADVNGSMEININIDED